MEVVVVVLSDGECVLINDVIYLLFNDV